MRTEDVSPRYLDLDQWSALEQLRALYEAQLAAVAALGPAVPALARAVEMAAVRLGRGGRLVYGGAGSSARIGVQDGAELVPTFSWPPDRLAFAVAGGEEALLRPAENAEDSADAAAARIRELDISLADVVVAVAASGVTPYTLGLTRAARERGALTIAFANNAGSPLLLASECPILLDTGAEPVAGSTRLKAGTAQKVALNLFSTSLMMQLGRVYRGMMVSLTPTNQKLRQRAAQIVERTTGCQPGAAALALERAGGDVRTAILIAHGLDPAAAAALLNKHEGRLRDALGDKGA